MHPRAGTAPEDAYSSPEVASTPAIGEPWMMDRRADWLDLAFSRANRGSGLFAGGWGDWQRQRDAGMGDGGAGPVSTMVHVHLDPPLETRGGLRVHVGRFRSPVADQLPPRARSARVWWLRPPSGDGEPVWLHMAGTNEGGPRRRMYIARPLARRGISTLVLENPLYGIRAPQGQDGNDLRTVADLLLMSRAAVAEARALLRWLADRGHPRRGVAGYSMGGHVAALVAATVDEEIACAAMATGLSAVPIFCSDARGRSIRWDVLGRDTDDPRGRLAELIGGSDLDRFRSPSRTDAAILLGAERDAYVRRDQILALHRHWRFAELRWMGGGHVRAYLRRKDLADAMADAVERL